MKILLSLLLMSVGMVAFAQTKYTPKYLIENDKKVNFYQNYQPVCNLKHSRIYPNEAINHLHNG